MKHTIILSLIYLLLACQDKSQPIEPIEEIPSVVVEDSLVSYATKEPYIKIEDTGFEAFLIAHNVDSDNQINGKIALEDIEKTDSLGISGIILYGDETTSEQQRQLFKRISLLAKKQPTKLEKYYPISIKNMKEIAYFKNLKFLGLDYFVSEFDTLDLAQNTKLQKVVCHFPRFHHIDVKNCKELKILDIGRYFQAEGVAEYFPEIDISSNIALEEFSILCSAKNIDFSKNINLKKISIEHCYNIETLDFCNQKKLESLRCSVQGNVYLDSEVYNKIDTTKTVAVEPRVLLPVWQKKSYTQWVTCK